MMNLNLSSFTWVHLVMFRDRIYDAAANPKTDCSAYRCLLDPSSQDCH
jgi:hypothetical protein